MALLRGLTHREVIPGFLFQQHQHSQEGTVLNPAERKPWQLVHALANPGDPAAGWKVALLLLHSIGWLALNPGKISSPPLRISFIFFGISKWAPPWGSTLGMAVESFPRVSESRRDCPGSEGSQLCPVAEGMERGGMR